MIPPCLGREAKREHTDLVNLVSVTMITQSIPVDCRDKWTLLFDSRFDYLSITVLIIKWELWSRYDNQYMGVMVPMMVSC